MFPPIYPRSGPSCAAAMVLVTLLSRHFRMVFNIYISHLEHADTLAFDPSTPPSPPLLHDTVIPLDRLACRSLKSCALPHPASGAHRRQPGPQSWGVLNSGILDFPDSVERLFSPMATSTHFFSIHCQHCTDDGPKGPKPVCSLVINLSFIIVMVYVGDVANLF